jgi:hypothetical protein
MFSPGGVHWSPLESGGICQIPAESADSHQTFPLKKSIGLQQIPPDSTGLLLFNLNIRRKNLAITGFEPTTL